VPKPTDGSETPDVSSTDSPVTGSDSAVGVSDLTRSPGEQEQGQDGKAARIPLDLVSGLFLLAVVAVFVLNAGDDPLDWVFPLSLSYSLGAIAVYLVIRGVLGFGDKTDTLLPVLHGRGVDVLVITLLAAIYVALVRPIGFWTMSAVMLFSASIYLDADRSRKSIAVSAVVAITVCVAAYVLLVRVLYVPIPPEGWLTALTG
jgi:hypothetical protein